QEWFARRAGLASVVFQGEVVSFADDFPVVVGPVSGDFGQQLLKLCRQHAVSCVWTRVCRHVRLYPLFSRMSMTDFDRAGSLSPLLIRVNLGLCSGRNRAHLSVGRAPPLLLPVDKSISKAVSLSVIASQPVPCRIVP